MKLCCAEEFDACSTGRFQNMDAEKVKSIINEEKDVYRKHGFARVGIFLSSNGLPIGICGLHNMSDLSFLGTIGIAYRFSKENCRNGVDSKKLFLNQPETLCCRSFKRSSN